MLREDLKRRVIQKRKKIKEQLALAMKQNKEARKEEDLEHKLERGIGLGTVS